MARDLRMLAALNDPALRRFLAAQEESARRRELELVIHTIAEPAIARVLERCRGALAAAGQETGDVKAAVLLRLLQKLESVRTSEDNAVVRLDEYVARLTFNAVADLRRSAAPEWARLKRRLRYTAANDPRLAVWDLPGGTVCGIAAWRDRTDVRDALRLDSATARALDDAGSPAEALLVLLRFARAPLTLDSVTSILAGLWDVAEAEAAADDEIEDHATGPVAKYETREELGMVWEEIRSLPVNQRAALLLNLRDSIGLNAVVLFPLTGVATFDEIAAAMEMSPETLAGLWPRLPLADLEIAETLGVSRQQVINLRKSARARLQRRLASRQRGGER
ncbi:MAG TPA: hypothetical protein VEK57_07115 [Thermoanaerobaculia bacterium]|nr:hypothetical protein [Thermoanaerobaculia bacterium]